MNISVETDADIEKLTGHRKIWWISNKAKYGSVAAVKAVMSSSGKVGGKATGPKGLGSDKISDERKAEIIRLGREARIKK